MMVAQMGEGGHGSPHQGSPLSLLLATGLFLFQKFILSSILEFEGCRQTRMERKNRKSNKKRKKMARAKKSVKIANLNLSK